MILDASALTDVLARTGAGERLMPRLERELGRLHAPDVIDAEVGSALRGLERAGRLPAPDARLAIEDLRELGIVRHPSLGLLPRAWDLRANLTIYDGLYVALAEAASLPLLTTDRKLARALRRHTSIELVPAS